MPLLNFKPWHLSAMRLTADLTDYISTVDAPKILGNLAAAGFAFTIVSDDGKILGIAGAVPREDDSAEVFVLVSEEREAHRVEFVKCVRRILDRAKERFARIDALVGLERTTARWFESLGFTCVTPERWSMAGGKT